jgi:hypothetical protein
VETGIVAEVIIDGIVFAGQKDLPPMTPMNTDQANANLHFHRWNSLPHRWKKFLLLIGLTLFAYAPAMRAGWIWDDDYYVTRNANLRDARGL